MQVLMDFGLLPISNQLLQKRSDIAKRFPLILDTCTSCGTAQIKNPLSKEELFQNYSFITPKSLSIQNHYNFLLDILLQKKLINKSSRVLEIGCNNGSFLKLIQPYVNFTLGIDPSQEATQIANKNGLNTLVSFFDLDQAKKINSQYGKFDLIISRHTLAHNEGIHDIVSGMKMLLNTEGSILLENAYWPDIIQKGLYDQVYHEHIYHHTIRGIDKLMTRNNLHLNELYPISIQGGSMAYIINHNKIPNFKKQILLEKEAKSLTAFDLKSFVSDTQGKIQELNSLLYSLKENGKTINAYGASAKASTLLSLLQLKEDTISFIIDSTESKNNHFFNVNNIPIVMEEHLDSHIADYYLITAWNYAESIMRKVRSNIGQRVGFIIPNPSLRVIHHQ